MIKITHEQAAKMYLAALLLELDVLAGRRNGEQLDIGIIALLRHAVVDFVEKHEDKNPETHAAQA